MRESDNNAKLIVLDRLDALRQRHGHVLDPLIMDILQVLSRYAICALYACIQTKPCIVRIWRSAERRSVSCSA